jgi:hypothetical protein
MIEVFAFGSGAHGRRAIIAALGMRLDASYAQRDQSTPEKTACVLPCS